MFVSLLTAVKRRIKIRGGGAEGRGRGLSIAGRVRPRRRRRRRRRDGEEGGRISAVGVGAGVQADLGRRQRRTEQVLGRRCRAVAAWNTIGRGQLHQWRQYL